MRRLACVRIAGVCIAMLEFPVTAMSAQTLPPPGRVLFLEHCSQCHGDNGTGNGPMAKVLTVTPADLTVITKRANGPFPADRIT